MNYDMNYAFAVMMLLIPTSFSSCSNYIYIHTHTLYVIYGITNNGTETQRLNHLHKDTIYI